MSCVVTLPWNSCLVRTSAADGLSRARVATKILFDSSLADLRAEDVGQALAGDPRLQTTTLAEAEGQLVVKLASRYGLLNSGGEYLLLRELH